MSTENRQQFFPVSEPHNNDKNIGNRRIGKINKQTQKIGFL